jgi:hypothetical protein
MKKKNNPQLCVQSVYAADNTLGGFMEIYDKIPR